MTLLVASRSLLRCPYADEVPFWRAECVRLARLTGASWLRVEVFLAHLDALTPFIVPESDLILEEGWDELDLTGTADD